MGLSALVAESAGYQQINASGNVCAGPAALSGIFVSSSTSGQIAVYDDAASGTAKEMVAPFAVSGAQFYRLPFRALKGLNIAVSGTVQATVGFSPETTR